MKKTSFHCDNCVDCDSGDLNWRTVSISGISKRIT